MQTAQGTMLESLRSVETFLDAQADKLGDVVKTGARQKLFAYEPSPGFRASYIFRLSYAQCNRA